MCHWNSRGSTSLGKRITNIRKAQDGTISFTLECTACSEGLENTQRDDVPCTKVFRDGMLLIEKNGCIYTLTGSVIR